MHLLRNHLLRLRQADGARGFALYQGHNTVKLTVQQQARDNIFAHICKDCMGLGQVRRFFLVCVDREYAMYTAKNWLNYLRYQEPSNCCICARKPIGITCLRTVLAHIFKNYMGLGQVRRLFLVCF
jgi:hypothetical protein